MKDLYPQKKWPLIFGNFREYHQPPHFSFSQSMFVTLKHGLVRWIFLCVILSAGLLSAHANPVKGHIVTKDDKCLSGYIGEIYHSPRSSVVVFINELGSLYHLEAELIKGFVCNKKQSAEAYKSQLIGRRWFFLKVILQSEGITLYQAPLETSYHHLQSGLMKSQSRSTTQFWLDRSSKEKEPERIRRWGYKKKLRTLLGKQAPELADKIGKKGYRFRDIPDIIEAYSKILREKKRPRT